MATERTAGNLDLLIKLLKMTTSSNDGEALTAMRKANEHATKFGGWEALMRSKVTIVADPFANIQAPPSANGAGRSATPAPPPRPRPQPAPNPQAWAAPPRPTPPPRQPAPPPPPPPQQKGYRPNRFAGYCYCCGSFIDAGNGFLFNPQHFNIAAPAKLHPVCTTCNAPHHTVPPKAAKKRQPSSSDLLNGL